MKKVAGIVLGAVLFGAVAGASMVGVNVAAQKAGIAYQSDRGAQAVTPETTAAATQAAAETQAAGTAGSGTAPASTLGYGSVSEVAKNAMPSVVAITNMMKYQANGFSLFGNYQNYETEVPASGSGVIVGKNDTELLIVTNNHVVADSSSLSVTFCDNESVDAEIKGTDASADLAVVAVKLSDIPQATMDALKVISIGNSDDIQVGDQVVAIGNALGYGQSVTTGIISAKDRDVQTSEGSESGLLQTDAAINPGNSGGALLNMQGELIGINVAKYSDTDVEGMGYSIPSAKAKKVIDSLSTLTTRQAVPEDERGYLGIQVKNIDAQTAQTFDMPQGVFIYKFTEGSNAENSGLQEKDIITALDGQGVNTFDDLSNLLSKYKAGETVKVTVKRPNGSQYDEVTVDVTLGSSETSNTNKKSGTQSQQNQGSANDPFSQNGGSSSNGNGSNGNGSDGSQGSNGSGSSDQEQLWQQFQQFFNQYQR